MRTIHEGASKGGNIVLNPAEAATPWPLWLEKYSLLIEQDIGVYTFVALSHL
jgi:hypothetical protein